MIEITLVIGVCLILWYNLFWKPFDWYRDLTELGYRDLEQSGKRRNVSDAIRKNEINELRRRRKIGDIPPVFPNGWFVILESQELTVHGVKEVNVLGLNLVAWRGKSGKAYVADAYCPHMGTHLGDGGKVHGECIQCPFHEWSFTGEDGSLKSIPYTNTVPQFAKLEMWKIMEMNGFIYLWYHAEHEEPTWFPEEFPEITSGLWRYRGRSEFKVNCHIQEVPENASDLSHFNVVHGKALMCGTQTERSPFKWEFFKHIFGDGRWEHGVLDGERHIATSTVNQKVCLFNRIECAKMTIDVRQVGPGTVSLVFNTMFGKGVMFHTATPVQPMVQRVLHTFYSPPAFIHPYAKLILLSQALMIERDMRIWNRKTYLSKPLFIKEDVNVRKFRQWFSQFYSENSPRYFQQQQQQGINTLEF